MNIALIDSRTQAEQLYNTDNCPRKDNGRKVGVMELTKKIWDEKGFAYLQKSSQNLRDQYANLKEKTRSNTQTIAIEMTTQKNTETTKDQEHSPQPAREFQRKQTQQEQRPDKTSSLYIELSKLANSYYLKIKDDTKEFKKREQTTFTKKCPNKEQQRTLNEIAQSLKWIVLIASYFVKHNFLDIVQLGCVSKLVCCFEKAVNLTEILSVGASPYFYSIIEN